jgi:hypothetical protein
VNLGEGAVEERSASAGGPEREIKQRRNKVDGEGGECIRLCAKNLIALDFT